MIIAALSCCILTWVKIRKNIGSFICHERWKSSSWWWWWWPRVLIWSQEACRGTVAARRTSSRRRWSRGAPPRPPPRWSGNQSQNQNHNHNHNQNHWQSNFLKPPWTVLSTENKIQLFWKRSYFVFTLYNVHPCLGTVSELDHSKLGSTQQWIQRIC